MTVTGTTLPFSSNSWVMPSFLPMIPFCIVFVLLKGYWLVGVKRVAHQHDLSVVIGSGSCIRLRFCFAGGQRDTAARAGVSAAEGLQLDLDVNARGELQAHQSLNRLVGRLQNVDQTLVGAGLELLTAVLILMNSAQNRDNLLVGGQGDRAAHTGAGAPRGLHDLGRSRIDKGCIVALQPNSDLFLDCHFIRLLMFVCLRRADKSHTLPGVQP